MNIPKWMTSMEAVAEHTKSVYDFCTSIDPLSTVDAVPGWRVVLQDMKGESASIHDVSQWGVAPPQFMIEETLPEDLRDEATKKMIEDILNTLPHVPIVDGKMVNFTQLLQLVPPSNTDPAEKIVAEAIEKGKQRKEETMKALAKVSKLTSIVPGLVDNQKAKP